MQGIIDNGLKQVRHSPYKKRLLGFVLLLLAAPVISYLFNLLMPQYYGYALFKYFLAACIILILLIQPETKHLVASAPTILMGIFVGVSMLLDMLIWGSTGAVVNTLRSTNFLVFIFLLILDSNTLNGDQRRTVSKVLWSLFILAIIVIVYQDRVDPLFIARNDAGLVFRYEIASSHLQLRYRSIFSPVGWEANGYTFMAIYGILLNQSLNSSRKWVAYLVFGLGFMYSFLTRTRWILVYFIIVSLQMIIRRSGVTLRNIILTVSVLASAFIMLNMAGVQVDEIVRYRILDEDKGGITEGSFRAREDNYEVFAKHFSKSALFGVYFAGIEDDYFRELGRTIEGDLIGIINPITRYGLLGSLPLYLFYFSLLFEMYKHYRKSGNISYLLILLGFLVSASSMGNFSLADIGLMTMLAMFYSESREYSQQRAVVWGRQ